MADKFDDTLPDTFWTDYSKAVSPKKVGYTVQASQGWIDYSVLYGAVIAPLPTGSYLGRDSYEESNKHLIDKFQSIKPEMTGSKVDKHPIHTGIGYEHKSSTYVPDHVTCLTGYRLWEVYPHRGVGHLSSVAWILYLEPGVAQKAICGFNLSHFSTEMASIPHDSSTAPADGCDCGYYSLKSLDILVHQYPHEDYRGYVIGIVDVWGRVIEHEHGYRSEYIYPRELWISRPEYEYLGDMYGVPIRKGY